MNAYPSECYNYIERIRNNCSGSDADAKKYDKSMIEFYKILKYMADLTSDLEHLKIPTILNEKEVKVLQGFVNINLAPYDVQWEICLDGNSLSFKKLNFSDLFVKSMDKFLQ